MHAVCDLVNFVLRKEFARHLLVSQGNAVDVVTQVEREVRHIEPVAPAQHLESVSCHKLSKHARHQAPVELIVSRGDRGVSRKHGSVPHRAKVPAIGLIRGTQQLERSKRRMALVKMERSHSDAAQRLEQSNPTDPEHDFLHETIASVAAIQVIGQVASLRPVGGHIGIEEQHRNDVAARSDEVVAPGTELELPSFDCDGGPRLHFLEQAIWRP